MINAESSDGFLYSLLEAAPDAMIVVDGTGKIFLANPRAESLFGYTRQELAGMEVEALVPDRYKEQHYRDRLDYSENPTVRAMGLSNRQLLAKNKDGTEIPVDIMLSPMRYRGQTSVIATIRDAKERREFEQKLATSEAMFRALYDQSPDAIIAVDRQGRMVQVNRRVIDFFQYDPGELLLQPVEILVPERMRVKHVGFRQNYMSHPNSRPMGAGLELYARRKDGSEFPVDIMLSPVQLPDSEIVISVIRDISERKLIEQERKERTEQLARSNQELEQFAYIASHDLQEPLRAVASSVQFLQRKFKGKMDDDANEFIEFAVDGAKRMQGLINDLLAYSRVGKKRSFETVDVNVVLERVLANLKNQIEESQARLHYSDLPKVFADTSQLVQIFQNLISNAMKFRGANPPVIEIAATEEPDRWVFIVKDNGIGIPERYREKIFVIFQRLHKREDYPGTGIGLAICKKIALSHGGDIWLESQVGEGTTFFFSLAKKRS